MKLSSVSTTPLFAQEGTGDLLMLRDRIHNRESVREPLFDHGGLLFREAMEVFGVDFGDFHFAHHMPERMEKINTSTTRIYENRLNKILAARPWRLIVCLGASTLKHAILKGGKAPDVSTLSGRYVTDPYHRTTAAITTLPDPSMLLFGEDDSQAYMRYVKRMFKDGLESIRKKIQ